MLSRRTLTLGWLAGLALGAAGAWGLRPGLAPHGLRAAHRDQPARVEFVALATSNDVLLPGDSLPARWTGYLYQPREAEVAFHIPRRVRASLTIDDQLIFATTASEETSNESASVHLSAGAHSLMFEVAPPEDVKRYFQAGLEWRTPLGWRLIPAAYLYPAAPDLESARREAWRARAAEAMGWAAIVCGMALAFQWLWLRRRVFMSRTAIGLALLVLLAFSLRLLFLRDFTSQPTADVWQVGTDHRNYQILALDYLRGLWPSGPFWYKPGISFALAAVYTLFGPHIRIAQVLQMLGGALGTLGVFDLARRTFGAPTGWAAALLWACFPNPIFYEAYLLTHGLEAAAGIGLLWLWLRLVESGQWRWLIACGLLLGASALLRPTFLALAPFVVTSVVWQSRHQWAVALARAAALAAVVSLPVAPVTWHNYRVGGDFQLVSGEGDQTLYMGNNRDSSGYMEFPSPPPYRAAQLLVQRGETSYVAETLRDIRTAPFRWLQLMARKTALLLSDVEIPNNADFRLDGAAISPVLRVLPLRFGFMMALALTGAVLTPLFPPIAAHNHRAGATRRVAPTDGRGWGELGTWGLWIVLFYAAVQIATTVAFVVFSRMRAPLFPVLPVLGGWAAVTTISALYRRRWRESGQAIGLLALSGGLVAALPLFADWVVARPIVAALPPSARALNAPVGEAVTLIGYEYEPTDPGAGDPLIVTWYWQSHAPLASDLHASLQPFDEEGRPIGEAQFVGYVGYGSYPDYPTSRWRPGEVVRDPQFVSLPADGPRPAALQLIVQGGAGVADTAIGPLPLVRSGPQSWPGDAQPVGARVGAATLAAYRAVVEGDALVLALYWEAAGPMAEDGIVFVHVFDAAGQFVAGKDERPRGGLYSTQAWQPGERILDEHRLLLPVASGEYRIAVGMYDAATQARLPVVDATGEAVRDNVLTLGVIQR
jgi:4-amino-4-deoxy-L-arabinose transferase-like glycosyltransferase